MALLTEYVPFVDRKHLQSFLASSNSILNGLGRLSGIIEEGYFTRMSLLLLSRACLYSTPEDIALIPECVWQKLENMQTSTGGFGYMEKDLCRALCQLRSESDAKTVVPPPPFVFEVTCLPNTTVSKFLPLGCQRSSLWMYHQSGSQP